MTDTKKLGPELLKAAFTYSGKKYRLYVPIETYPESDTMPESCGPPLKLAYQYRLPGGQAVLRTFILHRPVLDPFKDLIDYLVLEAIPE